MARPVRLACVAYGRFWRTSITAHGYRCTIEKAAQVAAREFFDLDAEEKTTRER